MTLKYDFDYITEQAGSCLLICHLRSQRRKLSREALSLPKACIQTCTQAPMEMLRYPRLSWLPQAEISTFPNTAWGISLHKVSLTQLRLCTNPTETKPCPATRTHRDMARQR